MSQCNLSECKHIDDLERELAATIKQRDAAMEAGRDMLETLTVRAAGGVYEPSCETVSRWRLACTSNPTVEGRTAKGQET